MCNDESVPIESSRTRSKDDTRTRILAVALAVLGKNADASMSDIASAAGVVRRTVYGYFPTRAELLRTLASQAADEVAAVLDDVGASDGPPEGVWVDFIARLWPLTDRYRVLLALRRGEAGEEIHALLRPVDQTLADLVRRGQESGVFGRHLPADVLSHIGFASVFTIADSAVFDEGLGAREATVASLLVLGVTEAQAQALVEARP